MDLVQIMQHLHNLFNILGTFINFLQGFLQYYTDLYNISFNIQGTFRILLNIFVCEFCDFTRNFMELFMELYRSSTFKEILCIKWFLLYNKYTIFKLVLRDWLIKGIFSNLDSWMIGS